MVAEMGRRSMKAVVFLRNGRERGGGFQQSARLAELSRGGTAK
jgi:hypothetical protein